MKENIRILKRILKYIKPYMFFVVASIIFAAVSAILSLFLPVLTGDAVDMIIGKGQVDWNGLTIVLLKMAFVVAVSAAAQWILGACNNHITFGAVRDIREDAMRHINELPLSYLDRHPTGETVSRIIADADQFADGLLMGFTQFFTGVITIIGTLVLMFMLSPAIAIVVVVLTPLSIFVASAIAKSTYRYFKKQSEVRAEQTTIISEMIEQEKIVQAFAYEDRARQRFNANNSELTGVSLKALFASSLTNPSTRFVNNMVYAAVAVSGAYAVIKGRFSIGSLTAFLTFATQYTKPFNEISGVVTELQGAIACAGRIFELIDEKAELPDADDAVLLDDVKGNIDIDDVCFSYTEDKKLLENVNIHAHSGERFAIVGPTGCGKTTLINLLMRFYDTKSGSIKVDDKDVKKLTRHSLRTNFGMVLQDTWLKPGTIRENIIMGKPDASDEEMIRAAKNSHAHSFIRQLPNGYDTVIGEDGGALSQGQKQLICISRVMLALPPMLILDEATSSIDTRTEIRIQKAFATMMKGRTSFIVAHRLSTIKEADCILVMKDGNIIEQGKHEDLLKQEGFYSNLYRSQFEV
ncbi:MAG: ABC transporter ATP-binding protein/permease [Lachnospiraceae bacterium]|nr:ABC transporter ATP-binding protein/permease [Lachnospiraceae bacterium]